MLKRLRYEYWPWYLFFLPVLPVCVYWMIRTGRILYFTAANPGIYLGGFFGESKIEILKSIPARYKPTTQSILPGEKTDIGHFTFPVILKPDIGERGNGVQFIPDQLALTNALQEMKEPHILQSYIDFPIELGILYYKYPDGSGSGITSITLKGMMTVTGDGKSTVAQLMEKNLRSQKQLERLKIEKPTLLASIPKEKETIQLEHRGNHCLGTEFINANDLINDSVIALFDDVTRDFDGFYYGRFDVKIKSIEDFNEGNVLIFELNGVSSEPGHIYDKRYNVFKAYRDVAKNWMIMGKISAMNLKRGIKTAPLSIFLKTVTQHFTS